MAAAGSEHLTLYPSFPLNYTTNATPKLSQTFYYTSVNNGNYEIPVFPGTFPTEARIEGGWISAVNNNATDHHLLTLDTTTGNLADMYQYYTAGLNGSCPTCTSQSGAQYTNNGYPLPANGTTNAGGTYITPLILRLQEVEQAIASGGAITHAIRISLDNAYMASSYVWPATTNAGASGLNIFGERIRLKSAYNCSALSSIAQIFCNQAKNYGFIVDDNGEGWGEGVEYAKWPTNIFNAMLELSNAGLTSSNFEVVDESSLEISSTSGECTCNRETITFTRTSDSATATVDVVLTGVTVNFPYDRIQISAGAPAYQLTALVNGASNTAVTWSESPSTGTISGSGLYTPPGSIGSPTIVTITATSVANSSIADSMSMVVFPAVTSTPIRIIPGSVPGSYGYQTIPTSYTDSGSNVWYSIGDDGGYANDQGTISSGIGGCNADPKLCRYGFSSYSSGSNDFRFDFIVPNGNYQVTYNASSPFASAGYTQDLEYNGTIVQTNLDLYTASGGQNKAWAYVTNVTVSNNILSLVNRITTVNGGHVGSISVAYLGPLVVHYVSSGIGSDSNNGTTKTTPWAHAPGMVGCTSNCASYTPVAGDQIVLRGGDTWTNTSLPWDFTWSGANGNPIYIGVDQTWYTGGSFTKPIINANSVCCATGAPVIFDHDGHIQFDNIEITGLIMRSAGVSSIYIEGTTIGDIFMENLYVHNWNRCTGSGTPVAACTVAVTDNSYNAGGIQGDAYSGIIETNVIIDHSEVGDPENGGNIGACAHNIEQFNYSYCHDASSGAKQGARIVHDSRFNNIGATFDGTSHQDVIYADTYFPAPVNGVSYLYNNLITNTNSFASATSLYPNPYTSNATASMTYWMFNNVVWGPSANIGIDVDPYNPGSSTITVQIHSWNNTLVPNQGANTGACEVLTTRAGGLMNLYDSQNTHCIGTTSNPVTCNGMATTCTATTYISMLTATATSQGYTTGNNFAPTLNTNSTVGAGANLTAQCSGILVALCSSTTLGNTIAAVARPTSGPWDVGAFELSSGGGTIYYIGPGGSDSNSGTSKFAPWLHAPGMASCALVCASTTPVAGNSFIFEGGYVLHFGDSGATPYAGAQAGWSWTWSGSSGNTIYIGVDKTWYTGGSWVRPVLTGDNSTSTTWVASCSHPFNSNPSLVDFGSSKYVTWDNFELTGVCWTNQVSSAGFVNIDRSSTTNISITNFYCHGWTMSDAAYDNYACIQSLGSTGNANDGSRIGYSVFDGLDSPQAFPGNSNCLQSSSVPCASGQANQGGVATFDHNVMRYLSNFIVSTDTSSVHDNLFEYLAQTFAGGGQQQANIIESKGCDTGSPTYWYNNITRHTYSTQLIYLPVCTTAYIFGNVFYDDLIGYGAGGCFRLNSVSNSAATQIAYLYNNTMGDASCQFKFEMANSPLTPWNGTGNFENNHLIGSTVLTGMYVCNNTGYTCTINDNGGEIYMTSGTATSQGYVTANNFAPTSSSNSTVGAGNNLHSLCSTFSTDNGFCNGTTGTLESSGNGGQIVVSPGISLVARPASGNWTTGAYQFTFVGSSGNIQPGRLLTKGMKINP